METIKFKGLSLNRDEHTAEHGELALCAGVELHDGTLRPSVIEGTQVQNALLSPSGQVATLAYVHETTAYHHFIATVTAGSPAAISLYWYKNDGTRGGLIKTFDAGVAIRDIDSIGNTLVIVADDAIHYAIYKAENSDYLYIGTKPPFVRLQFDVSPIYKGKYDRSTVDNDAKDTEYYEAWRQLSFSASDASKVKDDGSLVTFNSDKQAQITEGCWALLNETNNIIAKEGHFYAPFFVRYCYRMYDGTMFMHSAPVFMPITGPHTMKVWFQNAITNADTGKIFLDNDMNVKGENPDNPEQTTFHIERFCMLYKPVNVALEYKMLNPSALSELRANWRDIIKSIDVFISAPITREDSSQIIKTASKESTNDFKYINGFIVDNVSTRIYNSKHPVNVAIDIPCLSDEAYIDKIANTSAFFRLHSFDLDDSIKTTYENMPYDKTVVEYITTQEQMVDDYKTHNLLMPIPDSNSQVASHTGSYAYNHRLNLYGLREKLFRGFQTYDMMPDATEFIGTSSKGYVNVRKIVVVLHTDEGQKVVELTETAAVSVWVLRNCPVFYPDARAVKMYIYVADGYYIMYNLKACNELNGAMAVGNFTENYDNSTISSFSYTVDDKVNLANKIYTSEANNPFHFPPNSINTVGLGSIIGIAATTRALSQGQFGQFPLMAFATDGIWALAVSSTGTYSSIHNISREVVANPVSITQLDQSVVFVTARSMSRIAESTVVSMSDVLDGPYFNIQEQLPRLASYFDIEYNDDADQQTYKESVQQLLNFNTPPVAFFQSCRIIYDFVASRLLCIPATVPAGSPAGDIPIFIYSIRDNAWSTALIPAVLAAVNSNPYPYIQSIDGFVKCLNRQYDYTAQEVHPGLIVSRTLRFSEVPATITAFAQEHTGETKAVLFLFGSMDNRTWRYIGRSSSMHSDYLPGHSFRYFRLAVYLRMKPSEQYMATALAIREKYRKF